MPMDFAIPQGDIVNPSFQKLLADDDAAAVSAFIRETPGQLDSDDVKAALAAAFEQIETLKSLLRDAQRMA
jgi:hypothetical protein